MKKLAFALGLAVLVSAALWLPSVAQSEDTIGASVTVQEIAVSVSPTSVNYGTLPFETSKRSDALAVPVTFTATNDGNIDVDLKVRGADATFTGGSWTIQAAAPSCPTQTNLFRHSVIGKTGVSDDTPIFLTTSNSSTDLVSTLASAGEKDFNSEIFMPCTGSDGLGKTASTSITVVATASP